MFYLNVASLMVRLSHLAPLYLVPNTNTELVIKPLLKPFVKDPYKSHKYLLWFMFSEVQSQIQMGYFHLQTILAFSEKESLDNKFPVVIFCTDCILISAALSKSQDAACSLIPVIYSTLWLFSVTSWIQR